MGSLGGAQTPNPCAILTLMWHGPPISQTQNSPDMSSYVSDLRLHQFHLPGEGRGWGQRVEVGGIPSPRTRPGGQFIAVLSPQLKFCIHLQLGERG